MKSQIQSTKWSSESETSREPNSQTVSKSIRALVT